MLTMLDNLKEESIEYMDLAYLATTIIKDNKLASAHDVEHYLSVGIGDWLIESRIESAIDSLKQAEIEDSGNCLEMHLARTRMHSDVEAKTALRKERAPDHLGGSSHGRRKAPIKELSSRNDHPKNTVNEALEAEKLEEAALLEAQRVFLTSNFKIGVGKNEITDGAENIGLQGWADAD
jgi:hypothetical protein